MMMMIRKFLQLILSGYEGLRCFHLVHFRYENSPVPVPAVESCHAVRVWSPFNPWRRHESHTLSPSWAQSQYFIHIDTIYYYCLTHRDTTASKFNINEKYTVHLFYCLLIRRQWCQTVFKGANYLVVTVQQLALLNMREKKQFDKLHASIILVWWILWSFRLLSVSWWHQTVTCSFADLFIHLDGNRLVIELW